MFSVQSEDCRKIITIIDINDSLDTKLSNTSNTVEWNSKSVQLQSG